LDLLPALVGPDGTPAVLRGRCRERGRRKSVVDLLLERSEGVEDGRSSARTHQGCCFRREG